MRVLLVEQKSVVTDFRVKGLREEGFVVDWVKSCLDGMHQAREESYDLILLDRDMAKVGGRELIKRCRSASQAAVLVMSVHDDLADRIECLEEGADDYLVKPFAFFELVARMKALHRRRPVPPSDTLEIKGMRIDLVKRQVRRNGERINLTAQEFKLLALLADRSGYVMTKTQIASQIWDMNFDSETNVVEVAVRRLRAKIDVPFNQKLIHTVRGIGYVFEPR